MIQFIVTLIASFFVLSISYNANAFPKKSKSLFSNAITDSQLQEDLFQAGYFNAIIDFCNFAGVKNNKEYLKNIKGFIGYIHWDMFKLFNKGHSLLETQMYNAGVGWSSGGAGEWSPSNVEFAFDITGCDTNSLKMAEANNLNLPNIILFPFIKERSNNNYLEKLDELKNKLLSDRRDDYQIFIPLFNQVNLSLENEEEKNSENNQDSTTDNEDMILKLKQLKSLFDMELISKEEYEARKKEILDTM